MTLFQLSVAGFKLPQKKSTEALMSAPKNPEGNAFSKHRLPSTACRLKIPLSFRCVPLTAGLGSLPRSPSQSGVGLKRRASEQDAWSLYAKLWCSDFLPPSSQLSGSWPNPSPWHVPDSRGAANKTPNYHRQHSNATNCSALLSMSEASNAVSLQ